MASSSTDLTSESSTSLEQERRAAFRPVRSVLLCGASVRSLAESAIAAGLRPLCIDFFDDSDLTKVLSRGRGRFVGQIRSFDELPAVSQSVRPSVPLIWAGGLESHTEVLRSIARRRPIIGADPDVVDSLRHPGRLFEWLTDAGLSVPGIATASTADPDRQWLLKPMRSSGGLGIRTHSPPLDTSHRSRSQQVHEYLQEYIDGVPMSAVCVSDQHRVRLIGVSVQIVGWPCLGASDFLFCGNVGPVDPGTEVTQQLQLAARTIVTETNLRGVFGIDFVLRQGKVWCLEINPRITASHMIYESLEKKSGVNSNLVSQHLSALGWRSPAKRKPSPQTDLTPLLPTTYQARLILWAKEDVKIFADLDESQRAMKSAARIADIPKTGSVVSVGSPLCSLHISATSIKQLVMETQRLCLSADAFALFSWSDIAQQIELLMDRFHRNR